MFAQELVRIVRPLRRHGGSVPAPQQSEGEKEDKRQLRASQDKSARIEEHARREGRKGVSLRAALFSACDERAFCDEHKGEGCVDYHPKIFPAHVRYHGYSCGRPARSQGYVPRAPRGDGEHLVSLPVRPAGEVHALVHQIILAGEGQAALGGVCEDGGKALLKGALAQVEGDGVYDEFKARIKADIAAAFRGSHLLSALCGGEPAEEGIPRFLHRRKGCALPGGNRLFPAVHKGDEVAPHQVVVPLNKRIFPPPHAVQAGVGKPALPLALIYGEGGRRRS